MARSALDGRFCCGGNVRLGTGLRAAGGPGHDPNSPALPDSTSSNHWCDVRRGWGCRTLYVGSVVDPV